MSDQTKRALTVAAAALLLGVLTDGLIRAEPWGLNLLLWVGALLAAVLVISRKGAVPLTGEGRWLLAYAALPAAGFLWHDSETLMMLDFLAMAVTLALGAAYARGGSLRAAGVTDYLRRILHAGFQSAGGSLPLLTRDVQWNEIPRGRWSAQAAAVARGLVIGVPLLLVFGGLFIAADAAFEKLVVDLVDINLSEAVGHLVITSFFTALAGGYLRTVLLAAPPQDAAVERPAVFALGPVEISIALGLLNALFLAFVLVQFRYFFGGAALVEASAGPTYAEYARRGFFELVWVSALVLPLLLLVHWLMDEGRPGAARLFRILAGSLIGLLFIIMGSAVQRMLLYLEAYGLTELRFYSTVFMGWLALLFGWFAMTVLRGRRDRFVFGALVSGLALLLALHIADPDALIVRTNLARLAEGRPFDSYYVTNLSADAVPGVLAALDKMDWSAQGRVARWLLNWAPPNRDDWRNWNVSRSRAWRLVEPHKERLETMALQGH